MSKDGSVLCRSAILNNSDSLMFKWCVGHVIQQQGGVVSSVEDERVQELLRRVNVLDMDSVFTPHKEPLIPPRYRLMTRDQLDKVRPVSD